MLSLSLLLPQSPSPVVFTCVCDCPSRRATTLPFSTAACLGEESRFCTVLLGGMIEANCVTGNVPILFYLLSNTPCPVFLYFVTVLLLLSSLYTPGNRPEDPEGGSFIVFAHYMCIVSTYLIGLSTYLF